MLETVFYIFAKVVSLFLSVISLAMLVRVILQLVMAMTGRNPEENKFFVFCYTLTEIFVLPFRYLCAKFNLFTGTPIDAPFFIAYITLTILQGVLPII